VYQLSILLPIIVGGCAPPAIAPTHSILLNTIITSINAAQSVSGHLRDVHGQSWNEKEQIIPCARKGTPIPAGLDSNKPREQVILNELAKEFNEAHFRRLLVRWIVYDNVSFRQVDCEAFREFVTYLSPRAAQALPTDKTIGRWIMKEYGIHKAVVKEALQGAVSKISDVLDLDGAGSGGQIQSIYRRSMDLQVDLHRHPPPSRRQSA
jgi:hypothetical protein